jgi:DNA topoisomerase IB
MLLQFCAMPCSITKRALCVQEKLRLKDEKMKAEEKYMYALVDGRKEKVGNFRVEPPGLFRGRGEHPKMGKLKARIYPRDITINIGKGVPVPSHPYPDQKCVVQILPLQTYVSPAFVNTLWTRCRCTSSPALAWCGCLEI